MFCSCMFRRAYIMKTKRLHSGGFTRFTCISARCSSTPNWRGLELTNLNSEPSCSRTWSSWGLCASSWHCRQPALGVPQCSEGENTGGCVFAHLIRSPTPQPTLHTLRQPTPPDPPHRPSQPAARCQPSPNAHRLVTHLRLRVRGCKRAHAPLRALLGLRGAEVERHHVQKEVGGVVVLRAREACQ